MANPLGLAPQLTKEHLEICRLIAEGDSVGRAARKLKVSRRGFYNALARSETNSQLALSYAHARKARAEARAEEIDAVKARMVLKKDDDDYIDPSTGRVLIDAIKWQAAHENQGRYGDSVRVIDETPVKPSLSRSEALAQLKASGLRMSEVFNALTERAEAAPCGVVELPSVPDEDEDEDEGDLSEMSGS